jgi:hypothetical protein
MTANLITLLTNGCRELGVRIAYARFCVESLNGNRIGHRDWDLLVPLGIFYGGDYAEP